GLHALLLLELRERERDPAPGEQEEDHDSWGRPEPDRAGDRIRLLLRARKLRPEGGRLRDRDGEFKPGDRLDRLRHERPALLRAADARGRPRNLQSGGMLWGD